VQFCFGKVKPFEITKQHYKLFTNWRGDESEEDLLEKHFLKQNHLVCSKSYYLGEGLSYKLKKKSKFMQLNKDCWEELQIFSRAIELSIDAIMIGDLNGKINHVNDALLKMYGSASKSDFIGKFVIEFIADRDREMATQKSMEAISTGNGFKGEFAVITKSGAEIPVEVTVTIIRNEQGQPIGFVDILRDITERKQAEAALRESEENYHFLFANMIDGFAHCKIDLDESGKPQDFLFLEVNDAFEKLIKLKREDVIGKKATDALPGIKKYNPEFFEICWRVADSGVSQRFETEFKPLGVWFAISVYRPRQGFLAAIIEDIDEQKRLSKTVEEYSQGLEITVAGQTEELSSAQSHLLKAERLATIGELAGMVGHDLRNPLSGIKSASYYLRKKHGNLMDERGIEMLDVIDRSVGQANGIIADLLDYSREMHLEFQEYSPKSLINYVLLSVTVPPTVKIIDHTQNFPMIKVDAGKMERVFINLAKNAIEAMPNGGTLEIASTKNEVDLQITFTDTGIGMTQDVLAKLFTPLFTTKPRGMGLGLPICKRIVEAHGGKISVQSTQNKGTTFTIKLPS
jgi:PAS domain S-box-containing protein